MNHQPFKRQTYVGFMFALALFAAVGVSSEFNGEKDTDTSRLGVEVGNHGRLWIQSIMKTLDLQIDRDWSESLRNIIDPVEFPALSVTVKPIKILFESLEDFSTAMVDFGWRLLQNEVTTAARTDYVNGAGVTQADVQVYSGPGRAIAIEIQGSSRTFDKAVTEILEKYQLKE